MYGSPDTGPEIVSALLVNGRIEIIKRYKSNSTYACSPPMKVPDTVIKEIYGIDKKGKIALLDTITGKHTPQQTTPESIDFT